MISLSLVLSHLMMIYLAVVFFIILLLEVCLTSWIFFFFSIKYGENYHNCLKYFSCLFSLHVCVISVTLWCKWVFEWEPGNLTIILNMVFLGKYNIHQTPSETWHRLLLSWSVSIWLLFSQNNFILFAMFHWTDVLGWHGILLSPREVKSAEIGHTAEQGLGLQSLDS